MRICASSGRDHLRSSYTTNQYSKGEGYSRCAACVHGHHSDIPATEQSSSGRYNESCNATFRDDDLEAPFAQGAFGWVAKGRYTLGPRQGQLCVTKWFKSGVVFEDDYFILDLKAIDKALEIVNRFNDLEMINKTIKINVASIWTFEPQAGQWAGSKTLCEPFIYNYQKFNSNSGSFNDSEAWGEVMQALSHFSYHVTGGFYVLCDVQGGIYQHEVVLSDPVILSRNRDYGVTDLGPEGISSFFYQHECNNYCRPNWTRPARPAQYFRPVPDTSMIRRSVPTASSRPDRSLMFW